jgi:alanyl-tRNA synthetase
MGGTNMTEKLFYIDPYLKEFNAKVLDVKHDENGNLYAVLDQTAFYPTGGGQPHDIGTIGNVRVTDVQEINGEIRHYIEAPVSLEAFVCKIDWNRRFDHMQQHAGQHILTAAFEEILGLKTVSFHLGKELCMIDLAASDLTEEQTMKVEKRANDVILQNKPIITKWVTKEELSSYSLRKETSVKENIRLVIIPDFDYNGCGGTHPKSTGEVASIKILSWEKQRNHIRVTFVCGNRVLSQLHEKQRILTSLSPLLNAPQNGLEHAVKQLLDKEKSLIKELENLKGKLIQLEAEELIRKGSEQNLITAIYYDKNMQELQKLARIIAEKGENLVFLLVNESEEQLQIVCGKGKKGEVNAKEWIAAILPLINGKGGGNEFLAQGGGAKQMRGEELVEKALFRLESFVNPHQNTV